MVPTNIILCLFGFMVLYIIGIISTLFLLFNSIKNKDTSLMILSIVILIIFILFGIGLM
jgi:hypothetical protein